MTWIKKALEVADIRGSNANELILVTTLSNPVDMSLERLNEPTRNGQIIELLGRLCARSRSLLLTVVMAG